ncbi:methyl-accepting chemotaxis sensory transducer [Rhodoplanes sp. Z2-YC6860]|nr:methyl-accepting chemotaxis sensory transducer [Rhodoplanes sp. Z2-YC6860]
MPTAQSESQPPLHNSGLFKGWNSLAWRIILPVPITLIIVVGAIWATMPRLMESAAVHDAFLSNEQVAAQFKIIRGYYSENVVNKVLQTGAVKASHDHRGHEGVIPIPATLMHDLSALLASRDTSMSLYSRYPFPGRKDRKLDDFQNEAWDFLVANPKEVFSREVVLNGRHVVRTGVADTMSAQSCVNCHNSDPNSPKRDWKLGDVRGVLEIATVIDPQIAHGERVSNLIVLCAIIAGILLSALTYWAVRGVTRPLRKLVIAMEGLASGSFDVTLPGLNRKDEVGAMANAVEQFKVRAIERAKQQAEQEAGQRRAAAEERRSSMRRLADSFEAAIGNIVNFVSLESKGLEAAASTMKGIADSTKEFADVVARASGDASSNVNSAANAAGDLANSVSDISRKVRESSQIAGDAVRQAEKTDARITALSDAATRVGNVVKLITDIAEQTNLLALNATIEAARAGEAGRGFAVVAAEVKTLATQTAKATEEVTVQIAEMQTATADSFAAIKEIGSTIGRISDIATSIAAAIEQQGATTSQIADGVESAARSTEHVVTNLGNVNRAASESGTAAERVFASAHLLAQEGGKLKLEVDKFLGTVRAA